MSLGNIEIEDLQRLDDPCVVFQEERTDSDGVKYWVYTVGGRLDGAPIGNMEGGCTVGEDVIIIHAKTREDADDMAYHGLLTTIEAARHDVDSGPNKGIIVEAR